MWWIVGRITVGSFDNNKITFRNRHLQPGGDFFTKGNSYYDEIYAIDFSNKVKPLEKGISELPFLPLFVIKSVDEEEYS